MKKPIVFLSHSVQNKKELLAIKELLDKRAAGSIDFFLSSDGQSIRVGHNWVVSISDALAKAELMFVFLSPHALNSRWVHFEAGHAHAKGLQVVTVCLPGISFDKVPEPLRLLQGFNLHSAAAMGNLVRTCNETFKLKMNEKFTNAEFSRIQSNSSGVEGFFEEYTRLIDSVECRATPEFEDDISKAVETFKKISQARKTEWCHFAKSENDSGATFGTHGANLRFYPTTIENPSGDGSDRREALNITGLFGTELLPLNSVVVQEFGKAVGVEKWYVILHFNKAVKIPNRMQLTTRLFNTGIQLKGKEAFEFDGHVFSSSLDGVETTRQIQVHTSTIADRWMVKLLRRLFDVGFLVETPDDAFPEIERLAELLRRRSPFDI